MSETFREFVRTHVAELEPLETQASEAWWRASTTGDTEAYRERAELQTRVETMLADRESFRLLRELRESDAPLEPLERRQLEILYLEHLRCQCSADLLAEIVALGSEVEQAFATFRAEVDGRRLTENDVAEILGGSDDPEQRRRSWQASKEVGRVVADRVRGLVRLRNRAATELGFGDFYRLSLTLAEQSLEEIETLFDDLDRRTAAPYRTAKQRIDAELSDRFGVDPSELRPWDYYDPFFQDVPEPRGLSLDRAFESKDPLATAAAFFRGIGLPVEEILDRSDVHEREGKNQHAFCIHIDRRGDVRVLLNLKPTARWMSTVLHELGHGVYDRRIDLDLPYVLRCPAHTFVTEGVAMLFGRLPYSPAWITRMELEGDGIDGDRYKTMRDLQVNRQLVFARWCQVMVRFERALYENPEADLDALWWRLVERYQGVSHPEGHRGEDWAAKIHIVSTPVYYHNYVLGEMLASQLYDSLLDHLDLRDGDEGSLVGQERVGSFLTERVFSCGASLRWPDLVAQATGQPLSVESFSRQFR